MTESLELQLKVEELTRQNAVMHEEYSKYVFALDKISQLENDLAAMTTDRNLFREAQQAEYFKTVQLDEKLAAMTASKEFLDHKSKCLEMERQAQQTILQEQRRVIERTQAFLYRVRHWEEGKPDLHDTKEDIRAELERKI